MYYGLRDKVVLITGASRGIGVNMAKAFAEEGCTLVLTEVEERFNELEIEIEKIRKETSVKAIGKKLDIRSVQQIRSVINDLEDDYKMIQILINNAGTNIIKETLSISEEEWDSIEEVNLKGTFFVTQSVAKNMILNNIRGRIINIASQHGVVGNVDRAPYCASKAGIINMSKGLALEWAKYGIRINCISPTYVETDNNRSYLNSNNAKRLYLNKIPMKKYATPKDIAEAAKFLASDNSELITGQNIIVDGGYTCG